MSAQTFTLPSGARATLGTGRPLELVGPFGLELAHLEAELHTAAGEPLTADDLPLRDLHCVRAIARRMGLVAEAKLTLCCRNCGHGFLVRPSSTLELGPFRDGELDDPELDAPFDFSRRHTIPSLHGDEGRTDEVVLKPLTVGAARGLYRALHADAPLRVTAAVVRGMGIVQLGEETSASGIARLLSEAAEDAYSAVGDLFEDAHYPARLDVPHECPECGALCWVLVPASRELSLEPIPGADPRPVRSTRAHPFMDVDDFEALVRQEAKRAYAELGVRQVDLCVMDDTAEVDDGGEPLLGCYRPPEPDALVPRQAEIRLFFRTFAHMADDVPDFDVRAEVAETLRHELTHHLNFLAGDDPLDDLEQEEIHHERARRVGRQESRRRLVRALGADVLEFFRRTWAVWLIAVLVALWTLLGATR